MTIKELLEYEIAASWWANIPCLRKLGVACFKYKTKRKYKKYILYLKRKNII